MRTLVVGNDPVDPIGTRLRALLRAKADDHGPATAAFAEVAERLAQVQPEMVVVVLSADADAGLATLREVRRQTTGYVLAVGRTTDAGLIMRALREGADHYLDEADLEQGLDPVLARWQGRGSAGGRVVGRLIGVLAASGGSGASTLAVNIAAVLARDHGKCGLIDLKPGKGDLAALLDLNPPFHLADLCQNVTRLDQAMFEKVLVRHDSGVHLLASPHVFGDNRLVSPHGVGEALTLACQLFPAVVVDLEDCFHEEQLLALRRANAILLVSRLDYTSMRNVRRILDHLDRVGVGRAGVRLAANRYGQPGQLPTDAAEEAVGGRIAYYVPDDPKTVNGANNTGVPAVLKAPAAKVSVAIQGLARDLTDRRPKKGGSVLTKLFSH